MLLSAQPGAACLTPPCQAGRAPLHQCHCEHHISLLLLNMQIPLVSLAEQHHESSYCDSQLAM